MSEPHEYAVYAKVFDSDSWPKRVEPLTPENFVCSSHYTYQSMDKVCKELKAGLLFCNGEFDVQTTDEWSTDHNSIYSKRAMFLILCEEDIIHRKCDNGYGGPSIEWMQADGDMKPGSAIHIRFDMEHLFINTRTQKAVQLKVVDLRPAVNNIMCTGAAVTRDANLHSLIESLRFIER